MNIKFKQPKTLDGKQLIEELAAAGVVAADIPSIDFEGNFWLDIDPANEETTKTIVAAHVGRTIAPTIEEKLASVGLSITDLKTALGL